MGKITILPETPKNPITMIGHRAGICWGADVSNEEGNYKRGIDCILSEHGRTFEFPDVHMVIEGYSARVMREYYRHVGGLTPWLQASTRYINYEDFGYITPGSVLKNNTATALYNTAMMVISYTISRLVAMGIPKEDAANLLPMGMHTKTVEKRNLRNLVDMSRNRLCTRAYWEFRELLKDIMDALAEQSDEWKWIVDNMFLPKCEVTGFCKERYSCGRKPKKQEA